MYLVLTALLALNVSTSVLDAFKIIDEGLTKTQNTLYDKIQEVYKRFDMQYNLNKAKVKVWRDRANMVKERADSLHNHIQDLKLLVLREAEKKNYDKIVKKDGDLNRDEVEAVTDYDTPARIMIGEELGPNSRATILKNEIIDFKKFLLDFAPVENTKLRESIEGSLDTEPPKSEKRKKPEFSTWEQHKFGHSPLMGYIAIMSSLQINVRNAESEIVNYLYSRIDEGAIPFNELEATIIPNTNYVIRGNKYIAQVFIAARDTTSPPDVYVTESANPYKEVKDLVTGAVVGYARRDDLTYRKLPIDPATGKAIYEMPGSGTGHKEWGGIIEIKGPSGTISKPFKVSYQVAEGSVVVSATKMNVFYLGVDNPVDISVAGVPADKIDADNSNGAIIRSGGSWIVRPRRPGNSMIRVFATLEQKREVGFKEFRVKTVPDPVAMVANQKGGMIDKNLLLAQTGVAAVMENFDFDLTFTVTEFTVLCIVQGFVRDSKSNNNRFTDQQRNIIANLNRGNPVYIQDIKAIGPDGSVRPLGTINFKIN